MGGKGKRREGKEKGRGKRGDRREERASHRAAALCLAKPTAGSASLNLSYTLCFKEIRVSPKIGVHPSETSDPNSGQLRKSGHGKSTFAECDRHEIVVGLLLTTPDCACEHGQVPSTLTDDNLTC